MNYDMRSAALAVLENRQLLGMICEEMEQMDGSG